MASLVTRCGNAVASEVTFIASTQTLPSPCPRGELQGAGDGLIRALQAVSWPEAARDARNVVGLAGRLIILVLTLALHASKLAHVGLGPAPPLLFTL